MIIHLLDLNAGVANQGVAALADRLTTRGVVWIHAVRDLGELPQEDGAAWVLSGGPGSPFDDGPWRAPLLAALRRRVEEDQPTLAICYGFELLAAALGGEVRLLRERRFGVWPLLLTEAGKGDATVAPLDGAGTFENRSWGVFGSPGEVLARTPEGDVAAARLGRRVLGTIFHPEAGPGPIDALLAKGELHDEIEARHGAGSAARMRALGVGQVYEHVIDAWLAALPRAEHARWPGGR